MMKQKLTTAFVGNDQDEKIPLFLESVTPNLIIGKISTNSPNIADFTSNIEEFGLHEFFGIDDSDEGYKWHCIECYFESESQICTFALAKDNDYAGKLYN